MALFSARSTHVGTNQRLHQLQLPALLPATRGDEKANDKLLLAFTKIK